MFIFFNVLRKKRLLKNFLLNDIEVDVDRCQVTRGSETFSIEPRSMEVLLYLAKHPKQVISQQTLFDELWPNTLFSAGAVQRCIAQIRKALGENAQQAQIVLTHPKRGYSLDVTPVALAQKKVQLVFSAKHRMWGIGLLLSAFVALWFSYSQSGQLQFVGTLSPLTSTSAYDFKPLFSKDGEYVFFIRQLPQTNQIIRKHIKTSEETLILSGEANYQSLSWSYDYKDLYVIVRDAIKDTLFKLALDSGELAAIYVSESPSDLWHIIDTKKRIYLVEATVRPNTPPESQILQLDKDTRYVSELLASDTRFTPYRVAISPDHSRLALAGESPSNQIEIRTMSLTNKSLSEPFSRLELGFTEIAWHPTDDIILVHHLNQLFELDLSGYRTEIPYSGFKRIFNPSYSYNGASIALSMTGLDSDLVELTNNDFGDGAKTELVVDSNGEDHLARYSPSGDEIAYISSRAGYPQLFIANNNQDIRIFKNSDKQPIYRAPVWSKDSKKIAFSFGPQLFVYHLETKQIEHIDMPIAFTAVLDWYQDSDELLVATKENNQSYFSRFKLSDKTLTRLQQTGVNFSARLDRQDNLLFKTDDYIQFNQKKISTDQFPSIDSPLIAVDDGFIFQSAHSIYFYDGVQAKVIGQLLPDHTRLLVDAVSQDKFLFQTPPRDSANIVILN